MQNKTTGLIVSFLVILSLIGSGIWFIFAALFFDKNKLRMFREARDAEARALIIKVLCALGYRIAKDKGARIMLGIIGAAIITLGLYLAKLLYILSK